MVDFIRPLIGDAERQAVLAVLNSGHLAAGEQVRRFEQEFARYIGAEHGIATCNGTAALHAALHAGGIGPGDTVATTTFSFVASANAIRFCGATPLLVDIDPDTYNIDPEKLAEALDEHGNVRAVLVVHLFGLPADMDAIGRVCRERGVAVFEDCAQAHGARFRGRRVGTFGVASAFSFYATKNMMTGEGGIVLTNECDLADRARAFINHGRSDRYRHETLGYNFRMTDLAAALGRAQLTRLDEWNERRRANAAYLNAGLADLWWLKTPQVPPECEHVYHQYTIRTRYRDALQQWLQERGIGCGVIYPIPIHQQPAYAQGDSHGRRLPVAEQAAKEVLSLPVHPALTTNDLDAIIEAVRSFRPRE